MSWGGAEGTNYPLKHSREKWKQESVYRQQHQAKCFHMQTKPWFHLSVIWAFQIWLKLKMFPSWCTPTDCTTTARLYLYFVLYRTCCVFCSLMTILILFISEECHPGHAVDTDCEMDAAQRSIWRATPKHRSHSKANTTKQKETSALLDLVYLKHAVINSKNQPSFTAWETAQSRSAASSYKKRQRTVSRNASPSQCERKSCWKFSTLNPS